MATDQNELRIIALGHATHGKDADEEAAVTVGRAKAYLDFLEHGNDEREEPDA